MSTICSGSIETSRVLFDKTISKLSSVSKIPAVVSSSDSTLPTGSTKNPTFNRNRAFWSAQLL